jgi:putative ABC transport system substrate-binding protein
MQRRDFIAFIGGAAVGWPIFAYAQQPKAPVVGFLNAGSPDGYAPYVKGFLHGLGETGFVEGKNVSVDYRWARGEYNRLQAMAADLVRRRVAVIAANTPAAPVAKAATTEIPIVFVSTGDPVMVGKRQIEIVRASTPLDIEAAFENATQKGAAALLVVQDPFYNSRREQLVTLAARYKKPVVYPLREFAEIGGLVSYGHNLVDGYRQMGVYAGRILKGEKPADLPVVQPTKFEFVINLKTAKTLGLAIPPSLLTTADEVIE